MHSVAAEQSQDKGGERERERKTPQWPKLCSRQPTRCVSQRPYHGNQRLDVENTGRKDCVYVTVLEEESYPSNSLGDKQTYTVYKQTESPEQLQCAQDQPLSVY